MTVTHRLRRLAFAVLTTTAVAIGVLSATVAIGALSPVVAQVPEDAQVALEEFGAWRPHPRFGEVWTPTGVPPDWRPYQYGHWVYTEEWGWYWVSDDVEADWGWVVFHYGRWAFEPGFGWFWVPGDEWAPAWVNWRYGDQYVGWAPLPPDELIERFEIEPAYWVFVPSRFIAAPGLRPYIVPSYRRSVILRETRIVNRTVPVHGRLAVNPGISPVFVARMNGAPIPTYRVQPRVFASTQGVAGAVQVRPEDLRGARGGRRGGPSGSGGPVGPGARPRLAPVSVQRTTTVIQPNTAVDAPQPLGKNERGRLGSSPPRAAQGAPATAPAGASPPSAGPASTTIAPAAAPVQREERHERGVPGAPPGGSSQQPTVVRPVPPQAPLSSPPTAPSTAPATAPANNAPGQRDERREERREGSGPGGGPPPTIMRPIPPQAPPPPPPQQRQVQPPPPPPPLQQRQMQPPPPPQPQRQVQPPPGPPPGARAPPSQGQGPPPKKPPPKPGEKPDEKK
ncbi:MAG TPA: DUF6600 domain-containing protein [Pseudolabrys sp.]|nr:DUF6600 domain-containing protein [Pseudolabrys sp.]